MADLTIVDEIRDYLKSQEPLTSTSTRAIYDHLLTKNDQPLYHTVREAVQKVSLGSKTSQRKNTQMFYAMYLTVEELDYVAQRRDIILTLPGVHKDFIRFMAADHIKSVKKRFSEVYGKETVSYWISSTQLYSMALIKAAQKKAVVDRDNGRCRICRYVEGIFESEKVTLPDSLGWIFRPTEKPRVCHIISRSGLFWYELERVRFHYGLDIFSGDGVLMFKELLANNPMQSNAAYMVYLCRKHDNLVQQVLKDSSRLLAGH